MLIAIFRDVLACIVLGYIVVGIFTGGAIRVTITRDDSHPDR